MASSPAKAPPKKGGWGSLLSGAVAGLESRLDTILADDSDASARSRVAEQAIKDAKNPRGTNGSLPKSTSASLAPPTPGSRDASRTRVNDRLAERLAKATAAKTSSQSPSAVPSRVASPPLSESGRSSVDSKRSTDIPRSAAKIEAPTEGTVEVTNEGQEDGSGSKENTETATLLVSKLPINPAKVSTESSRPSIDIASDGRSSGPSMEIPANERSTRPSIEVVPSDTSPRPSSELPNGSSRSAAEVEAEMMRMLKEQAETESMRQEEMQTLLEKVDALQSKLQYLAKETVAAAKEANAATSYGSTEQKLAEKDQKIALLMEEGEKLSKTELRHLQTIKKLRAKGGEDEKAKTEMNKRLERLERSESDLKAKLRRADVAERQANEKTKQIGAIETQVEQLRVDREHASGVIRNLTAQLKEAKEQADRADLAAKAKAAEVDKNRIATLENELEDAQIEKKLAEDRAASESQKLREDAETAKQRFSVRELELKSEISSLDSKLEAMRSRAEEASAEGSTGGEGNVKLIRQVETLQSQYALAKENWETIEGSLNARLAAMEKERDEAIRRETELRRKARDVGVKSRKAEDELESTVEKMSNLEAELQNLRDTTISLRTRLDSTETALEDARADAERHRKVWDAELAQRVEEEKIKWMHDPAQQQAMALRNESPVALSRKTSTTYANTPPGPRRSGRPSTHELLTTTSSFPSAYDRPPSRRSSAFPPISNTATSPFPADQPPPLSRHESGFSSLDAAPTPTSVMGDGDDTEPPSPDRTIADFVSHSTAAGPSVQLVERMSAAVRRLESEKAAFKDELARLAGQRDAARDDVVALMREVEEKRASDRKGEGLTVELRSLRQRYDGALELLGEREEEVEELRGDVVELKRIYRELVEKKIGGSAEK